MYFYFILKAFLNIIEGYALKKIAAVQTATACNLMHSVQLFGVQWR